MSCADLPHDAQRVDALPSIFPDYVGVTIPVGIAPLNFTMASGDVDAMDVTVKGAKGGELHANGTEADFDVSDWHELLAQNKGSELTFTVCEKKDGSWKQYQDFTVTVSPYALDEWGLTYRRIAPGYEVYSHMGLYQRDLSCFDETAIIENTQAPGMCVNCHTSDRTNPDRFVFHVRGEHGATMIQRDGVREWLKAKNELLGGSMVYPYWHPSGKYCAFSTNQTRQGFHITSPHHPSTLPPSTLPPSTLHPQPSTLHPSPLNQNRIEVFDQSSDIFVYNVETRETLRDSLIMTKDWSENVPVFSPDGRSLYFMTCLQKEYPQDYKGEQYNLCRIDFDPATGKFGTQVDTLFNAVAQGKSLTWPRPSYDGRYILFTLQDYGYFSIWHEESDQWLLDLQTGEARAVEEINSPRADSYHNWNVNSHWIVFTSRRGDGLYSRLYLASVDETGHFSKPFLLPQRHPRDYYDRTLYSFNTPDFTARRVEFDARTAGQEILSDERVKTK
ncbi:MAG: PD40 domain-containing protein [Prevotella sp.]|nr:PD40 domain-containing protein [Prevotella sp.]